MRSLCWRFGAQQGSAIDCFAKRHSGLDVPPEKRDHNFIVSDTSFAIGQRSVNGESKSNNIVVVSKSWDIIEKNNWGMGSVYNWWHGGNIRVIDHDGISC
jgi:hypothetical protein